MKRKRKRSTILRARLITYIVAFLMILALYITGINATPGAEMKLLRGGWLIPVVVGLMLYIGWQKLGTRIILGTSILQGFIMLGWLSLYDLSPFAIVSNALTYILPILGVGVMLRLLQDRTSPPDDAFTDGDFSHLQDGNTDDNIHTDEQRYHEQNQRRLKIAMQSA